MENIHDILVAMSLRSSGDWEKVYAMLKEKVPITREEIDQAYGKLKCQCLAFTDAIYPENLKNIWHPPFVLFYYGNISLLDSTRIVSVVGSREPDEYSLETTDRLVREILTKENGVVIASGMAKGIDSKAQRAAMALGREVIAVLGSGIDRPYPDSSEDIYQYCRSGKGLVLSEYPLSVAPDRDHFPFRNRIIAGLCQSLLVTECKVRSGTSITVRHAVEFGKNVVVVPHDFKDDDMTGMLIKDGADVALEGADILNTLTY